MEYCISVKLIESIGHVFDECTKRFVGVLLGGTRLQAETKRVYALGKAVLDAYPILPHIDRLREEPRAKLIRDAGKKHGGN